MTILPKKHKPVPSSSSSGSGNPSGSSVGGLAVGVGGGGVGGDAGSGNEDPEDPENEEREAQANDVSGGNSASGWGPGPYESSSSAGVSGWSPAGSSSSPSRWSTSGGSSSSSSTTGEKRPSPSSVVSGYDYDGDCSPTASKRRNRGGGGLGSSAPASAVLGGGKRHKSSLVNPVPNNLVHASTLSRPSSSPSPPLPGCSSNQDSDAAAGGYNSEDEYSHLGLQLTDQEWEEKDRKFEKMMKKKGYVIKHMVDDGSCLFRAVADQVYGDQEMHGVVRGHCMDYVERNGDYFSQYMTEELETYVSRKRYHGVHGNHLEIQALSEMYNRPIHIYCYSLEPINIFQTFNKSDNVNVPLRLSYHRLVHYNSLVDPHKATIGIGLGLPGHSPGAADRSLLGQAEKASEEALVEQVMLEDKIKTTDWEATNEAIEEQIARESYLQFLRDNERRKAKTKSVAATVTTAAAAPAPVYPSTEASSVSSGPSSSTATMTSGELRSPLRQLESSAAAAVSSTSSSTPSGTLSPKACCSKRVCGVSSFGSPNQSVKASCNSPKAGCSSDRDSPKPCSSQQRSPPRVDYGFGDEFKLSETETFLTGLQPQLFGFEGWSETDVLAQVLAASQQEYLDGLKKQQQKKNDRDSPSPPPPTSGSQQPPPKSPTHPS